MNNTNTRKIKCYPTRNKRGNHARRRQRGGVTVVTQQVQYICMSDLTTKKTITEGGMGRIDSVVYNTSNCEYAMKTLLQPTQRSVEMLQTECNILYKASGICTDTFPNMSDIPQIKDVKNSILMPLLHGIDFYNYLDRNPNANFCIFALNKVINALKKLHQHRITHGDLKPGNIYLDCKLKKVIIIDFGYSLISQPQSNLCRGTPKYMAPEICILARSTTIDANFFWNITQYNYYCSKYYTSDE